MALVKIQNRWIDPQYVVWIEEPRVLNGQVMFKWCYAHGEVSEYVEDLQMAQQPVEVKFEDRYRYAGSHRLVNMPVLLDGEPLTLRQVRRDVYEPFLEEWKTSRS